MPEAVAEAVVEESLGQAGSAKQQVYCMKCGGRLARIYREGFLEQKIYPVFGYYPWRCRRCGEHAILRKRHEAKKKKYQE